MRSKNTPTQEVVSTVVPPHSNSCTNCWNEPKTADTSITAPRHHGIYCSVNIYLVDKGNKTIWVGYRAQCPECGDVKIFKNGKVAYRLVGNKPDFAAEYWPELRKHNIDPFLFQNVVMRSQERYFEIEKLPKYRSNHRAEFYEPAAVQ